MYAIAGILAHDATVDLVHSALPDAPVRPDSPGRRSTERSYPRISLIPERVARLHIQKPRLPGNIPSRS